MERRKQITYILDSSTENLCNNLQPQNILQRLKTRQVLSGDDIREITSSPRMDDQVDRLLEMLKRRPSTAYEEFMNALLEFRPDLFHEVQAIELSYVSSSSRKQYYPPPPAPAAYHQPSPPAGGSNIPSRPSQPSQPLHQPTAAAANIGATSTSTATQPVPNTFPADLSERINRLCINTCNFDVQQEDTSMQEDVHLSDSPLNMDGPTGMPSFENISPLDLNMPVPGSVPCYPMTHERRGLAIIFNNDKFVQKDPYNFQDRRGSGKDANKLVQLFSSLKFDIWFKSNLTAKQMHDILDEIRRFNHQIYDCFVCCIMTHGQRDMVFGSDSVPIHIHDLTGMFKDIKCNSLLQKPKLFFIQACQGDLFQPGASLQSDSPQSGTGDDILHTIPIENDFLVGYSTVPGYISYRHPEKGSWYVSTLTRFIHELHDRVDMANILTMVNGFMSKCSDKEGYKQTCSYRSTLTKALYL